MQLHWLADGDPLKIKTISEGPAIDFFVLLDEKIKQVKKTTKRIQQTGK